MSADTVIRDFSTTFDSFLPLKMVKIVPKRIFLKVHIYVGQFGAETQYHHFFHFGSLRGGYPPLEYNKMTCGTVYDHIRKITEIQFKIN